MSHNTDFKWWVTENYVLKNVITQGIIACAGKSRNGEKTVKEVNSIFKTKDEAIKGALQNQYVQETGRFKLGTIKTFKNHFYAHFTSDMTYFSGTLMRKEDVYKLTTNARYHNMLDNTETTMFVVSDSGTIYPLWEKNIVVDENANQIWPIVKPNIFNRLTSKFKEFTK
ncbi:MAG: hypothetical protein LBF37_01020 [Rickettsiales bacterium]|jgi:hypothetical protein|nr:hypothetical protein [Rickettsiales bacterium]